MSTNSFFDLDEKGDPSQQPEIKTTPTKNTNLDFFNLDENETENQNIIPEKNDVSKFRSIISTPIKTLGKEFLNIAESFDPYKDAFKLLKGQKKTIYEAGKEKLEDVLPTREEYIEGGLERATKLFPWIITGGGGLIRSLITSGASGFSGQSAKELGAPEWVQNLAEITPQVFPAFMRRIIPTLAQENAVNNARRLGLNEEQIAPLIQSEGKQRWFSRLASRRGRTQRVLQETQRGLGNIYNNLKNRPEAQRAMTPQEVQLFLQDLLPELQNLPHNLRNQLVNDAADLAATGYSGSGIINFWQDINSLRINRLNVLQGPLGNALRRFSPQLAEDFMTTNNLYGRYANLAGRLRPTIASDLFSGSQALKLLFGISTGNYPVLIEAVGEEAAKRLSREMLINPRFQNLSRQMIESLNTNRLGVAKKISDEIADLIREELPEEAANIDNEDFSILGKKRKQK